MDRDPNSRAAEDTTRAERHVENAAENRDALARENRAVEATTNAPMPRHPASHTSGGAGDNEENVRHAAENRDALTAEARRVERTAPPEVDLPQTPEDRG